MNRFLWLVRREVWEHKAIWVAPAIVNQNTATAHDEV